MKYLIACLFGVSLTLTAAQAFAESSHVETSGLNPCTIVCDHGQSNTKKCHHCQNNRQGEIKK
jgi:hypothetical protein